MLKSAALWLGLAQAVFSDMLYKTTVLVFGARHEARLSTVLPAADQPPTALAAPHLALVLSTRGQAA